jgi:hypothetical protein
VKETAIRYFVEEKHVLEYIRHLKELQVVSAIRENPNCTPSIPDSGVGALKILKMLGGGHRKFTNNPNRGPVKI